MTTQTQSFAFAGGLNVADEQMKLKPGEMTDCLNIEVGIAGGYKRADGFERTDGRDEKPSLATYRMLSIASGGPRELANGDVITGRTSGATAVVCGQAALTSGAWAALSAAGAVGVTQITGTFIVGERVTITGIEAFSVAGLDEPSSLDDVYRTQYIAGAANAARALITQPPGSGPTRAVFTLKGAMYAIRDNAGGTAGVIHRANGALGWTAQPFNQLLGFDTGGVFIPEGSVVNGQTSGATATVARTAFSGGDWNSATARGNLSLTNVVGTFQDNENIRVGVVVSALVNGAISTPTLAPGGTYEVVLHNFYGAYDTQRAYIVNGVGKGFEFSEGVYVPMTTGMPDDKPEHITIHKNYVFMSFKGSVQNSGVAEPHAWTARLGSNEIGAGDYVTALYSLRQDVLCIATTNTLQLLYGSNATDWDLKNISKMNSAIGAFPRCVIDVPNSSVVLDSNGVQAVTSTASFGDFEGSSLSRRVNKLLRAMPTKPVGMVGNRIKSQIRIIYPTGEAIYATYAGDKIAGWSKLMFPKTFEMVWNGEDADGAEVTLAAGTDGYVYQLDSGNSFDGEKIAALIRLPFHHYGSPERRKRWRKLVVELSCRDVVPMQYATEYDYSGDDQYLSFVPPFISASGGFYDKGYVYGDFVYDGGVLTKINGDIDGVSANLGILIYSEDDTSAPWTAEAAHIHFSPYGLMR